MTVLASPLREGLRVEGAAGLNWRATALAAAGLVLTFAAPQHRIDLLVIGLVLLVAGLVWSPLSGPLLIGATLPFFFFGRPLAGPLAVTPPGLALMVSWVAVVARHRQLKLAWPRTAYDVPLALLLIAALLSLLVTEYPLLSVRELRAVIFEPVLFFWLLHALSGSAAWALRGFLTGATITAVAAIAQGPLGVGGTAAEGVLRAQAWYPSANHLALMLGRAWPFLLAGGLASQAGAGGTGAGRSGGGSAGKGRRATWLLVPAGLVGLALLLTFSTGGWLGGLAGGLAVIAVVSRRRLAVRAGLAAALALVVASGLAIGGVLPERLNPLRQTGGFRLDLWLSSLEMMRDHPLLGIGLDNFAYLYQQVYLRQGAAAEPNLSHPHNWLLQFWLDLGLLGLVAFVWLVWRFARQVRTSLDVSRSPTGKAGPRADAALLPAGAQEAHERWMVAGAVGAMVDLLVHGLIDNSYFLVDLAFVFWLTLALVEARRMTPGRGPLQGRSPPGTNIL
ncbi:MAG TPA: O-antigen ligase family protein, partial [Chloroflexota bacterium]|nr:O-antigen ligase family protein [Chloroflexota bacterium]